MRPLFLHARDDQPLHEETLHQEQDYHRDCQDDKRAGLNHIIDADE